MKELVRALFRRLGYDIRRWRPNAGVQHGFNAAYLSTIITPRTVFDVGVGFGTFPLYEAFPRAKFILVEPLSDYDAAIGAICAQYDCRLYRKAVGSEPGELELTVNLDGLETSSFHIRSELTRGKAEEKRRIELTTLDLIFQENPGLERPILLKIDTEGFELEVLKGSTHLLQQADMVIAEISVAKRFEGSYRFEDAIIFMKDHGFRLMDVLFIAHAAGEVEPRFMDIAFVRDLPGALSS